MGMSEPKLMHNHVTSSMAETQQQWPQRVQHLPPPHLACWMALSAAQQAGEECSREDRWAAATAAETKSSESGEPAGGGGEDRGGREGGGS